MGGVSEVKLSKIFAEAFCGVVIPVLEDMEGRLKDELASKKDLEEVKVELSMQIEADSTIAYNIPTVWKGRDCQLR